MSEFIQVTTTASTRAEAETIANVLLDKRLAACIQVLGPIESRYRWKGNIEHSAEWICVIKTVRGRYADVEKAIRENHSYEVPEIVACPIEMGSSAYLAWLRSETAG
jgi:periplasmic divalent cation tolerance protein